MWLGDPDDWNEFPINDDHLPFKERAWVKRIAEREAARERFDRLYPDFFAKVGRAIAIEQTELAMRILMGGEE